MPPAAENSLVTICCKFQLNSAPQAPSISHCQDNEYGDFGRMKTDAVEKFLADSRRYLTT
jgi:hypothetical protein